MGHETVRLSAAEDDRWWRNAIGYCLYLRSFADGNGDGIGDLWGVIDRLDYLESLGVEIVWITPFYPSPMADFGYDVTDHCAIDPTFGDLAVFSRLIDEAHRRGLAVVVDLVANHTSAEHWWFQAASQDVSSEFRDHYIWADPGPDGSPPNNWVSYFGGPAWTFEPTSGQYYLHLFLPEQPDLNWRNPAVAAAFDQTLRFWLERGVDGFRIDVAQGLVKAGGLPSNPQRHPVEDDFTREQAWAAFEHRYDILQPESMDVFARWKRMCDEFGAMLMGEVSVADPAAFAASIDGDGLDIATWLETLHVPWDASALQQSLREPIDRTDDPGVIGWLGSSLDEQRAATRFGGGSAGRRRSLALAVALVFLPGVPFFYQGEELGLEQSIIPEQSRADPVGDSAETGRDGCRTPMPWSSEPGFGFTNSDTPWLPFGDVREGDDASAQGATVGSWLDRYRRLILAWHDIGGLGDAPVEWIPFDQPGLVGYRREAIQVILNVGVEDQELRLSGDVLYRTWEHALPLSDEEGWVTLPVDHAIVVRREAAELERTTRQHR